MMLWRFGVCFSLSLSGLVRSLFVDNLLLLQWIVLEELLNQVNVCEHHSPTAVSLELESVEGVTFGHVVVLEVREIRLPLVTDDLAAREASDRNDHCWLLLVACCVLPPGTGAPLSPSRLFLPVSSPSSLRLCRHQNEIKSEKFSGCD